MIINKILLLIIIIIMIIILPMIINVLDQDVQDLRREPGGRAGIRYYII